ncbi:polyserase-2-like [Anopheles marshallii]|uniref:polyserase-2-like n=1 Tax=Anopheles marshallii TaxID=1521116 RepID=UPI00237C1BDB|nr:polyserase-2-like [Anopheles marshallii]
MGRAKCYAIALVLLCLLLVVESSVTQTCGKRKVVNQLIVNGTEAKDGYWPWHVAIFHNKGLSFDYACGGTILDQNTVLTAAHCVMTSNGLIARRRLVVQVGRHRISLASKRVQEHEAFELIVHPEYNVNRIQHDIALIMLATDITYTDYIQPICLWNRGDDLNLIVGSWGTVIGFGRDETDETSDTLREASIPVVNHITCIESNRETFAFQLTSNMFCAGNRDGVSACNGDSGGGLFFNYNDVWFVRGVVSFTKPRQNTLFCDTKEYTAFTDVAKYLSWIGQHIHGIGGQPVVVEDSNNRKIGLLPMSTCGANRYASRNESTKPVMLGYPWMGLIECTDKVTFDESILCQAALISDMFLVGLAQCAKRIPKCFISTVRLGDYDINNSKDCAQVDGQKVCSPPVQTLRIQSVIAHPEYNQPRYANDIAIIRLRDRADTTWINVKPICLPVTHELRSQKSTHYIHTSWPLLEFWRTDTSENLLERSIGEFIDSIECQNMIRAANITIMATSRQICIKQQSLQSESEECKKAFAGTPLQLVQQVDGESRYVLYGMLSIGPASCTHPLPDVYTSVPSYMDWILENIQE